MPGDDADLAARMDGVVQRGRAEFPGSFDTASHFIVGIASDQTALRHALGELGDDAHRVVARLANDPDEAARVLALRGPKLGAALGKYAAKVAEPPAPRGLPKPKAEEPIPVLFDPTTPMKQWEKAWNTRHEGQQPYTPKITDLYDPNISDRDFGLELDRREREKRAAEVEKAKSYRKLMRKAP